MSLRSILSGPALRVYPYEIALHSRLLTITDVEDLLRFMTEQSGGLQTYAMFTNEGEISIDELRQSDVYGRRGLFIRTLGYDGLKVDFENASVSDAQTSAVQTGPAGAIAGLLVHKGTARIDWFYVRRSAARLLMVLLALGWVVGLIVAWPGWLVAVYGSMILLVGGVAWWRWVLGNATRGHRGKILISTLDRETLLLRQAETHSNLKVGLWTGLAGALAGSVLTGFLTGIFHLY